MYSGVFNLIQTNLFNLFYLSNPFRRRNKLYHSFSSCNSFKCMKHILGFVSKLFKKCNLIMFVMLNIRYFHRSSIIWFINSLFPKNMLTLFLQWQALLVITEREKCLLSNSSLKQSEDLRGNTKSQILVYSNLMKSNHYRLLIFYCFLIRSTKNFTKYMN